MKTSITAVTNGQKKQVKRFAEDAVDRTIVEGTLNKDGIQKLIENGDEFQASLIAILTGNQFADEEVQSSYAYPKGYKVKGITEQTNILRQLYPGIPASIGMSIAERSLPPNAEGWFAIPKWETLAPTYGEAVKIVFAMIASKRMFYSHRKDQITGEDQIGPEYLRQHQKTVKMFQKLGDEQKNYDILVVPCQFGFHHRGRSVRRAREVFTANEFGLGVFAIGIMLLTHPERLQAYDNLFIDCAGDEFSSDADGNFKHAPVIHFRDGGVKCNADWFGSVSENYGSASAFLQVPHNIVAQ